MTALRTRMNRVKWRSLINYYLEEYMHIKIFILTKKLDDVSHNNISSIHTNLHVDGISIFDSGGISHYQRHLTTVAA